MNNNVNRIRNCDIANLNRSWEAANKQIDNINLIADTLGLDILDDRLQEVAILRMKYPDATFLELSELYQEEYNRPISKSGINHRLRKINEIADRIRNSN